MNSNDFNFILGRVRLNCRGLHGKKKECAITNEHLLQLWNKQMGHCAFTGVPLISILPILKFVQK